MSRSTVPAVYRNNWIPAKTDPNLFASIYCSTKVDKYNLLPHQELFIKQFLSGKFEELWMAGGNSAGKTYTGMFMAAHAAAFKIKPGKKWTNVDKYLAAEYNILCTGPEQKQAIELWEKIEAIYKNSPFLRYKVESVTLGSRRNTHPQIKLKNGTSIEAVGLHEKGKHVEGEAYDLILVNEPADVRHLVFILDKVLGPRTWRRGGTICGFGTPKGKNDYWLTWRRGRSRLNGAPNPYFDKSVYSMFADSRDNKYADLAKINRFLQSKNKDLINERIKGLFTESEFLAFPDVDMEKNFVEDLQMPISPSTGRIYLHGVDFGRKEDYTVCITADVTEPPYTIVNFYRKGGGIASWEEIMGDLARIHQKYGGDMVVDATASAGDMQTTWLTDLGIPFYPYQFGGSPGKKVRLINNLQDFLAKAFFRMPYIVQLREELHGYPRDMVDKGMETDCVMALALLAFGIQNYGPTGEPFTYRR